MNGFAKEDIDKYLRRNISKAICNPSSKKEEFAGLIDFRFKPEKTANFLFKLNGIILKKNEYETIDNVFIHSCLSEKFSNLYTDGQKQLFFGDESVDANKFAIIGLEQSYRGIEYAKKQAILQINHAVRNINAFTNYRCTLDEKNFILTSDFTEYSRNSGFQPKEYRKEGFSGLHYDYGNSAAIKELKEFDYLYEYALIDNNIEKYWHYIEIIYKSVSLFEESIPDNLIKYTPKILLHEHQNCQRSWLRDYIFYCVINRYNESVLGYTQDERMIIFNQYSNFDIEEMKKRIATPFILDLIKIIESPKSEDDYKEIYEYYKNTLRELYEYRNHYVHEGKKIKNIRIKMEQVMPTLISKFRIAIEEEAERHPKKDLKTIIQSFEETAKTKFNIS